MKALFLTTGFCLLAALRAQNSSPLALNNRQLSGKWYMKALVMKDNIPIKKVSPIFVLVLDNVEGKSQLEVQPSSVKDHWLIYCDAEMEGMHFTTTQLIARDPKENLEALEEFKEFTQKKGLVPDNLAILEQMVEGKSQLEVQPSSVKDHWLIYCDAEMEGMHFTTTQLIARDPKENLEALEEFKEFTQKKGLVPDNLAILEQMDPSTLVGDNESKRHVTVLHLKVTVTWKTLSLASTNRSVIEEGGAYQCFMTGIVRLANGNLNVTYFHRKDGKCVKEFLVAEKTDIPGRYTFEYQGKNYLTFVAVTKDFLIMDYENHREGNILIVVELHGAMTLLRAWLLFVAFNIDLAQKNLEEVPVQPDFDAHKVEGRWFTIQLATSHRDLVLPTDPLRLSLHSIQTRDSGDVDFVLFEKRTESSETFSLIVICLIPARRMLEDPTWLGKYLVFVEKFHLQKAPIFNIAGKSCPPAAPQLFKEVLSFSSIP
ncbi:Vomeronasal secretory protein 1 [Microtus ochrogaster]|uniref:Vomeronasal secretory protein 1 n=1 Tax=Microtus ochrogaster TaxID=79684 RepID=A0A8J6G9U0_MICOH|nr:Vomeronasal secretory protein 1 [Microtus ochrogaster]